MTTLQTLLPLIAAGESATLELKKTTGQRTEACRAWRGDRDILAAGKSFGENAGENFGRNFGGNFAAAKEWLN